MKTRILTGILFTVAVAVFLVPGFWSPVPPMIFFAIVAVMAISEMNRALGARIAGKIGSIAASLGAVFSMLMIPVAIGLYIGLSGNAAGKYVFSGIKTFPVSSGILPVLLLTGFSAAVFIYMAVLVCSVLVDVLAHGTERIGPASAAASGAIYVALPLFCAISMLYALPDGIYWVIPALVAPWVTDVTAFFAGSFFGRHKIVPSISPKKTWEGSIGGMLGCMAALPAWIFLAVPVRSSVPDALLALFAVTIGLSAGVAAQAGDWFASAIKRWCGIKDFGAILPGHGGVLDRFDSVFFTLPLFFAAAVIFESL